jgi:hypothetical protein
MGRFWIGGVDILISQGLTSHLSQKPCELSNT